MAARSQEAHFDDVASEYDESLPAHVVEHLLQRRVRFARGLVDGGDLLDVGCGTGRFLTEMQAGPYNAVGVDVSEEMLTHARARGVTVHHASAAALPFPDRSFDLVVSIACMHHLIDPAVVNGAVDEMCRVVRPGGALMIWDHNPLNPYWHILMRRLPQDQGDERLVKARTMVARIEAAELTDISVQRVTFMPDFTPARAVIAVGKIERQLERIPGVRLLAAHNVITARRA
jgi:ubiquinone/menaquinone biosynthesis C-methylase UbiE